MSQTDSFSFAGFYATAASFIVWGLSPMYWRELSAVPAFEVMCHRVLWACVFVSIFITCTRRWSELRQVLRSPGRLLVLAISGSLVGANWLLYFWAVNNGYVLQASLGYYINPLANVLIAALFFNDRLRPVQKIAFLLAGVGVLNQLVHVGELPWVAFFLAGSFAAYGAIRKKIQVEAAPGLMIESVFLLPVALGYLFWLEHHGQGNFLHISVIQDWLLIGGGLVTAGPLVAFAFGARRLSLITVGMLQYIAPSLVFLQGIFLFHEPFSAEYLITFVCIWGALLVYSAEGIFHYRLHNARTL